MAKRIIVIGAGIAGLSAASYLQRNGFDTEIYEMHDKPGGLCASWSRKGFTFDGCIHWLMGSGASSNLHHIWKELGAGDLKYHEWDVYTVVDLPDGERFTVYTDPDRLEAEILRIALSDIATRGVAPEDARFAKLLSSKIKAIANADMPAAFDKLTFGETLKLLVALPAAMPVFTTWTKVPLQSAIDGLGSPKLRAALSALYGDSMPGFPLGGLIMMLGFMAKKSAGYPLGGSLAFARAIEAKYRELGGEIHYRSKVDRILIENGRAVGVKGAWGESRGDFIVSAADGRDTLDRMLGGIYRGCEVDRAFGKLESFPSLLFVGLGLDRDCADLPHSMSFELKEPIVLEGGALVKKRLTLRTFNFDPSLAPAGKTSATVMIDTRNDAYWTHLAARDPLAYAAEKKAVGDAVIAAVDSKIPGFASWVVAADVATPKTFIDYTNNWRGSFEGWLPKAGAFGKKIPRTIAGIRGFEMVGQWLNPGGGLPPAGMDGRNLAKRLCKAEGRAFTAD